MKPLPKTWMCDVPPVESVLEEIDVTATAARGRRAVERYRRIARGGRVEEINFAAQCTNHGAAHADDAGVAGTGAVLELGQAAVSAGNRHRFVGDRAVGRG